MVPPPPSLPRYLRTGGNKVEMKEMSPGCHNHYLKNTKSPETHRHTCQDNRSSVMVKRVRSLEDKVSLSPRVFHYKAVIVGNDYR